MPRYSDQGTRAVVRRLLRFFRVADLRCTECGEWLTDPAELGIRDTAEWEAVMVTSLLWIRANPGPVLDALPALEPEWHLCCEVVRGLLRLDGVTEN